MKNAEAKTTSYFESIYKYEIFLFPQLNVLDLIILTQRISPLSFD